MLWFDNRDDCDLRTKLERAMTHYRKRHGIPPTLIVVHPGMLIGSPETIEGVEIRASNDVLPNHFWMGQQGERRPAA